MYRSAIRRDPPHVLDPFAAILIRRLHGRVRELTIGQDGAASRDADVEVWWFDQSTSRGGTARRAALRRIIGSYAGVDPSTLAFDRSCQHCGDPSHGRPRLVGGLDVSFSTASRSGCFVVAAAKAEMSVGVDIETAARFDTAMARDVWRVALTPDERRRFNPEDIREIARLWCRKEAVLKAMGLGIAGRPPDTLDVGDAVTEGWHVLDLQTADPWVGAVAASSPIDRVLTMFDAQVGRGRGGVNDARCAK
jgi:hypothetical protein